MCLNKGLEYRGMDGAHFGSRFDFNGNFTLADFKDKVDFSVLVFYLSIHINGVGFKVGQRGFYGDEITS